MTARTRAALVRRPTIARPMLARLTVARPTRSRLLALLAIVVSVAAACSFNQVSRSAAGGSRGAATGSTSRAIAARDPGLVWHDEFSGTAGSPPNPANWQIESGPREGTLQRYTRRRANVSLDGEGHLVITAQRARNSGYTSGAIETEGRFQTTYGRIEARIALPDGQGLWPAFWMIGSNVDQVGWPQSGEIDVMENYGKNPFKVTGSIHGPWRTPHGYARHADKHTIVSMASGFHTYEVIWSPDKITFALDGYNYATMTPAWLSRGQRWVFNKPFFLILNLAIGGQWAGSPARTPFPERMLVDWVRVYRLAQN